MTEGEAPAPDAGRDDAGRDDAPLVVPPGVPLRVLDWLLPPLFFVVPAVVLAWVTPVPSLKPYAITTAAIVVAVASMYWLFGFRAFTRWDDADVRWLRRSEAAALAALGIFAVPYLFGMTSAALFAGAAYRVADDPSPAIGHVRSALSPRAWIRLKVVSGIVAAVALVAHPLASAFGFGLLAVIVAFAAALTFGVALRAQPRDHAPLPPRTRR